MTSKSNIDIQSAKLLCEEELNNKIAKLEKMGEEIERYSRNLSSDDSFKSIERKIIGAFILALITGPISIGFSILFLGVIVYYVVQHYLTGKALDYCRSSIETLSEEYDELLESIENFQDECINLFDDWQEIDIPLHPNESDSAVDRLDTSTEIIKPTISKSSIEDSGVANQSTVKSSFKTRVKFNLYDFLQVDVSATDAELNDAIKKVESKLLTSNIDDTAKVYSRSMIAHAKTHLLDPVKRMEYNKSIIN